LGSHLPDWSKVKNNICPVCLAIYQSKKYPYKKSGFPEYVKCRNCWSLYLNPMPNQSDLNNYYANLAEDGAYSPVMGVYREKSIEHFIEYCDVKVNGVNWLDFGCFDGYLLQAVQELGAIPWGIEIQAKARESANLIAGGRVVSEPDQFEFDSFDVVSMKDSIEHLVDPGSTFEKISKKVVTGSKLFIQTPNANSYTSQVLRGRWPGLNSPEHTIVFSDKGLEIFLRRYGWEVVKKKHIKKKLSIGYVLHQLSNFGGFSTVANKIARLLPGKIQAAELDFFGGEFFVYAIKNKI
jgi:2-polyprenyl-3-methyl-5-hydroxy-6-metoxy-1,4-benzoquinol methylase